MKSDDRLRVGQLRELLKELPDDAFVVITNDSCEWYGAGFVRQAKIESLEMNEDSVYLPSDLEHMLKFGGKKPKTFPNKVLAIDFGSAY